MTFCNHWRCFWLVAGCSAMALMGTASTALAKTPRLSPELEAYPPPVLPFDENAADEPADDSLAAAISEAFVSNPELAAGRYDLRASDDEIGIALADIRPQVQLQVAGSYDFTIPGTITSASRPLSDRLNNPNIERNEVTSRLVIDQPISTGGRVRSAVRAAMATSAAGRQSLRGVEGDLLVELIASYSDVRRDKRSLVIRQNNVRALEATLDEVIARREAGELTRTDIAQAEAQLQAARVQLYGAEAQLEASRAAFAAIVGREPGNLAAEPDLPNLPATAGEAFAVAELSNPDLAAAMATERASRERIAVAKAEGRPTLALRGTAGTTGPALPFDRSEQDVAFTGGVTLTIPLVSGGRVRALEAQARNRESADALRVEATRRKMVQAIINAWNQWVTAARNVEVQDVQLKAARIYYEGTLEEYREGLRSTFDVLYAQNSLRETEIALLATKRDRYVAQAVLLRQMGKLETRTLLTAPPVYDPAEYTRKAQRRGALPWDGLVRGIDGLGAPGTKPQVRVGPKGTANSDMIAPQNAPDPGRELQRGGPGKTQGAPPSTRPKKSAP